MSVKKQELLALTSCSCTEVQNFASAVADRATLDGLNDSAAELMFAEALDPTCEGERENPNNYCGTECCKPTMICGDTRGPKFLLLKTIEIRGNDMSL
jgi:hypothetical protein